MEKQILSEEFKRMQKLAGINESDPQSKEYTVDDFILQNIDKKYYQPFFNAIFKDKSKEPDWDKITSMSAEELKTAYDLSIEDATAIKTEFDKKLNEDNSDNSVVNKKVKNFLNNEIFNLEEMNDFNMREKMLKDVSNTIEEEIGEFVRKKFREERYTRRF
jgi:hypothetical protein